MNFFQMILEKIDFHYSPFEITGKKKCDSCGKWHNGKCKHEV